MENRPILNDKEKLAAQLAGESTTRIVALDGSTAEDVIKTRNINNFNNQVDKYVEKFEKHTTNLKEYAENINDEIEIMPIGNYVLVKQFEDNPFQRIVRDNTSGLILDLGGAKPEYKNTDNGNIEEEESFIKVGVIQEVGPECKFLQAGDTIMYTKVSAVPVPFYKQGLILVNETRALVTINSGLTERFAKFKK